MKTRTGFCIVGLFVIMALGIWQLLTADTLIRQRRNMQRARELVPIVRAKLDEEFRQVCVQEFTAAGGSLLISGEVATQKDVERVREVVQGTQPPVEVVYTLIPTNESR